MKPLIGKMALIFAVFLALLLILGSGFGQVEIMIWLAALVGSLSFVVWWHRAKQNA